MDFEENDRVAELQAVLTRYVDSTEGYAHASRLVGEDALAPLFIEIGEARARIIPEVAAMVAEAGVQPKAEGSIEGLAHRWWMSAREKMSADETATLLEECIRGEKVLLKAIDGALQDSDGDAESRTVLAHARDDVRRAISHFEAAVHDREFE